GRFGQQGVQGPVAVVEPGLHARLEHAVALFLGVELAVGDHLGAAVAEVDEGGGVDGDVRGHAVPFEGLHDALLRGDLPEAALEAVRFAVGVFDETPVPALAELPALDIELVAATPPARQLLDPAVGVPHTIHRRVEDAFDVDLGVRGGGDDGVVRSCAHRLCSVSVDSFPADSRNSP